MSGGLTAIFNSIKGMGMNYLIAGVSAVFVYSFIQVLSEFQSSEKHLLKKRITQVKKFRRYQKERLDVEKNSYRLNLSWIRIPKSMEKDLKTSGLKITSQEFAALWAMAAIIPPILLLMLGAKNVISCGVSVMGAALPPVLVRFSKKKRVDNFQGQLGEALLILSNTVRAGFTFERAMLSVAEGLPDPIREELIQTGNEIQVGTPVEDAMDALADRMQNDDLRLVTSAVLIQKRVGGNLADILDNISSTIKDRIRIKRNIKTMTAQGRISAQVIGVLPFALVLIISVMTPGYMDSLFSSYLGRLLLLCALILEGLGFFIMLKMTDLKY